MQTARVMCMPAQPRPRREKDEPILCDTPACSSTASRSLRRAVCGAGVCRYSNAPFVSLHAEAKYRIPQSLMAACGACPVLKILRS